MKSRGETDENIEMSIGSIPKLREIFKMIKRGRGYRGQRDDQDCRDDDGRGRGDDRQDCRYRVGDERGGCRNTMDEKSVENTMDEKTVENTMDEKTVENMMDEETVENATNEKAVVEGTKTSKRKAKRSRRSRR